MRNFDCWAFARKHRNLDTLSLAIMAEMAFHYDLSSGDCKISLSELADGTAASKSSIVRHLKELEDDGFIKVERLNKVKNNYWIKGLTDRKPKTEAEKAKEEKFEQYCESFLSEYPSNGRVVKRTLIQRKFRTIVRSEKTFRLIMKDLRERKARNWDTTNNKFIMDAQNYLTKESWLDEAPEPEPEMQILEGSSEYVLNKIL